MVQYFRLNVYRCQMNLKEIYQQGTMFIISPFENRVWSTVAPDNLDRFSADTKIPYISHRGKIPTIYPDGYQNHPYLTILTVMEPDFIFTCHTEAVFTLDTTLTSGYILT
jgi:hypothetical protein